MQLDQLATKLITSGIPLIEIANGQIYAGIHTGLDAAFIIDQATRKELVIFDPSCAPLIKPIMRSADLRPWYTASAGHWLIELRAGWIAAHFGSGLSVDAAWSQLAARYLSIARHLQPFAEAARGRPGIELYWWELPAYDYYDALGTAKLCWPVTAERPRFVWDETGARLGGAGGFIANAAPYLLGVLASRASWFVLSQHSSSGTASSQDYDCSLPVMARLPIPDAPAAERAALGDIALHMSVQARARYELHVEVRQRILKNFGPPGAQLGPKLDRWWELDFPTLLAEVQTALKSDIPLRYRAEWEEWHGEQRRAHDRLTAAIATLESELNTRVYALFDLTPAEVEMIENSVVYRYGEV